jgi:hypothetical protein
MRALPVSWGDRARPFTPYFAIAGKPLDGRAQADLEAT